MTSFGTLQRSPPEAPLPDAAPAPSGGAPRSRRVAVRVAKIVFGLALLALLFRFVDLQETVRVLRGVDPRPALVAVLLAGLAFVLAVARWRTILAAQRIAVSFGALAGILLVSMFFNTFLPGGGLGADVIRAHQVGRRSARFVASASSVLLDRVVGLTALLALGLAASLAGLGVLVEKRVALLSGTLLLACIGALAALLSPRIARGALRGGLAALRLQRWQRTLEQASTAMLEALADRRLLARLLALSFAYHLVRVAVFFGLARALGVGVTFLDLMIVVPVVGVVHQIPLTVSGLGFREGAFVYFFGLLGIAAPAALAFSLLERLVSLLHSLAGGVIYVLRR